MRRVILKHPKAVLLDAIIDAFGNIYIKECFDSIYHQTIELAINGEYELEFEDGLFKIDEVSVFKNLEKLKENPLYKDKITIKTVSAEDILEYTNQNIPPIDLTKICEFFKIKVEKKDNLLFDGLSKYDNGYYIIYKSGITSPFRERFTIAHELGHIFLHFSEDKKTFEDTFLEKIENLNIQKIAARGLSNISVRKTEKEADNFAAELLMPEKIIINTIFNKNTGLITISKLSEIFKVSKQAIKIRLINLGIYSPIME